MDHLVNKYGCSHSQDYFDKLNERIASQQRKREAFEKFRPIFERVRDSRRNAFLLKSASKGTPKKFTLVTMPTPLRVCQSSQEKIGTLVKPRSQQHTRNKNMLSGDYTGSQRLNEGSDVESKVSSQECRRALEFESGDEGDEPDDHTTPLRMMDVTCMIRGTSILQDPYQEEQKENHQPVLKEAPLTKPSSMKKIYSLRNRLNENDGSQITAISKSEKKVVFKTCLEDITDESSQNKIPMTKSLIHPTADVSLGNVDDVRNSNARHVRNVDLSKDKRSEKEQKSTRKMLRKRRSAIPSSIRTFSPRVAREIPKFMSASKLPKPSRGYHNGKPSQTKIKMPMKGLASQTSTTRVQETEIPRIDLTSVNNIKDEEANEEKVICKVDKCDASTSTTIRFVCDHSPDALLSNEVKKLIEEQDQIDRKAEFLLKQILSRSKQMKESGIMESFCTALSPVRRLQILLKEKEECTTSDYVSPTPDKMEGDSSRDKSFQCETYSTPENNNGDRVIPGNIGLDTANESNATPLHWDQMEQDDSFFQTPSSAVVDRFMTRRTAQDEENFEKQPGNASPFAQLVGDCERPSLAPMTPHSRQQISHLKTCLKKQLEQLYD